MTVDGLALFLGDAAHQVLTARQPWRRWIRPASTSRRYAASTPDKAAVVMHPSGQVRTYREIDEASIRLAKVLRERGLGAG